MICLDLTAAGHERAGLGRYAANLALALRALDVPLQAFINDPSESRLRPPLSDLVAHTAHLPRKPWRLRVAASYFGWPNLNRLFPGVTLFHATEHLLPRLSRIPTVLTLHDVAYQRFPQYHLATNRLFLSLMMPRFLARADRIIAVSEHTRQDALRLYKIRPEKIEVIPEGVEARFKPLSSNPEQAALRQRYHLPERFILFVGTIEPRKNLPLLLEVYRALRADARFARVGLVIAGGRGWLYQAFFDQLKTSGLEADVGLPGHVPDDDLPGLLSLAEVFAFPSIFEGFGLPPLEAMACGIPVVCSNTSSLPEVVGDAGLLLPPDQPRAWVEALGRVLDDAALRAELGARGRARAARFTWEATARRTLAIYEQLPRPR